MTRVHPQLAAFMLVAGSMLAGCSTYLGPGPAEDPGEQRYAIDRVVEDIVYTPGDWPQVLAGDLYLPARRGKLPVVLAVHGGGWANRSREDMEDVSRKLAQHGYAVFNIGYRFAPRYTYPAQLHDLQQALRWLAANASRYRFDLERVNTWGYSSGAHLAALLGSYEEADGGENLPRVNAVVAGGTPSDLRKYSDSPIVMRFMGGDRDEMPDRYADASPVRHITAGDPPVFLYHGKLDFLVTTDQATDYYEALRAAGIDAELYLQSWRGHMSMFLFGGDAEDRAIEFLNRQNSTRMISSADRD
ncbi:MAG: alpha/beta hydrolase [Gammaproteobacteria bacterium]